MSAWVDWWVDWLRGVNQINERVGKCVGMTVVVAALAMAVLVMWSGGGVVME